MSDLPAAPPADPILFWNGPAGERWVTAQAVLDRTLEPFGRAVLALSAATGGERVVDVGCGCGTTTLALAAAVGPAGRVVRLDVSAPMLARARERARDVAQASFVEGDAAAHRLDQPADLLFSRFGVMFFADPAAALANLRAMLRPGGRLAFVCWRALQENAWAHVPLGVVSRVVGEPPAPLDAEGPGPFAFADPARVRRLLEGAGFASVGVEPFDHDVFLGDDLAGAVEFCLFAGPSARLLASADEAAHARAREALHAALAPAAGGEVALPGATWLVTARAGAPSQPGT